jgi:hypothetical protein
LTKRVSLNKYERLNIKNGLTPFEIRSKAAKAVLFYDRVFISFSVQRGTVQNFCFAAVPSLQTKAWVATPACFYHQSTIESVPQIKAGFTAPGSKKQASL